MDALTGYVAEGETRLLLPYFSVDTDAYSLNPSQVTYSQTKEKGVVYNLLLSNLFNY